jgi:hypothetical protein
MLIICIASVGAFFPATGHRMVSACPSPVATAPVATGPVAEVVAHGDITDTDTTEADTTDQVERKSPGRALLYSLGGTVILAPVLGIGLVVGPAFGHYYANNRLQASIGTGIRGLSAGVVLVGTFAAAGQVYTDPDIGSGSEDGEVVDQTYARIAAAGLGVLIASALVDIVMAPFAAQDYNQDHGLEASVRPTAGPGADQVGVALQVQF